jgi:hypothetical protein
VKTPAEPPVQALSLAEWAVLALLCEGDAHGWMLVRVLAPDAELGAVWTVRRIPRTKESHEAQRQKPPHGHRHIDQPGRGDRIEG